MKTYNEIFNKIEKNADLQIESKMFGSRYFIFNLGVDSVCHFTIEQTPDWKYGIWLDEECGYKIFGEHIDLIDKFKPSRTYLSYKDNELDSFISDVKKIAGNPKLYFVESYTGDALVDYEKYDDFYTGYQVVREFNEESGLWDKYSRETSITQESFVEDVWDRFQIEKQEEIDNEEHDRKFSFEFFKSIPYLNENICGVGIVDRGGSWSPRYEILVFVDKNTSEDTVDDLYKILESVVEKECYSEKRKTYKHKFYVRGVYGDNSCYLRRCNYKYFR